MFVLLVLCTAFAVPSLLVYYLVYYIYQAASSFFEAFREQYENEGLVGAFKDTAAEFKYVFNYIRGK